MEEEGRPAKIQKLDHGLNDSDVRFADPTLTNGASEGSGSSNVKDQVPTESKNVDMADALNDSTTLREEAPKISKNQLKKLRRQQQWEDGREARKEKRREKEKARRERRREEYKQKLSDNPAGFSNTPEPGVKQPRMGREKPDPTSQLPVSIIFDCDFDDMMFDQELKSLGTQITRCYSDNRHAKFRTHLAVASFGGKLKERFNGVLGKQYTSWHGFRFFEEDFVLVAEKAKEWMKAENGGAVAGALAEDQDSANTEEEEGEIVYLSSESDVTLERLKPHSTYIIGGLVDHNRHKGICYKRATERGIKTAKLPIGEFLQMNSRAVLATNHVLEIMLKWLELGDWGEAFMQVIPKRKGGTLKSAVEEKNDGEEHSSEADKDSELSTNCPAGLDGADDNIVIKSRSSLSEQSPSIETGADQTVHGIDSAVPSAGEALEDPSVPKVHSSLMEEPPSIEPNALQKTHETTAVLPAVDEVTEDPGVVKPHSSLIEEPPSI
ncbi:hypothetical protein GQ43DRAFT_444725 [Delitschia confertaspora ATCC 74209]|uniref:tRNA (guanine(9)-N1)-methyltransferase n=1 Tax=Delitschia confertaspora ATCC 74209 TaxID=1513339 RepID=A0A9P4JCE3_9PLEO|nr:hypothetical protein GQ43DRAFT_444725 [Delitschia confertaspora ATCC 74209]